MEPGIDHMDHAGTVVFTIGFTKKGARDFFELLRGAGVRRVIDVRLNNTSQLSGFAKQDDLKYFLCVILGVSYAHHPELAPTDELLRGYRKKCITWDDYRQQYRDLMEERRIEASLERGDMNKVCFLCSEPDPDTCHRSILTEYLCEQWGDIQVHHL